LKEGWLSEERLIKEEKRENLLCAKYLCGFPLSSEIFEIDGVASDQLLAIFSSTFEISQQADQR